MKKNNKYNIEEFFVGELYLYTNFANYISESYNPINQNKVNTFSQSGAINFCQEESRKYIDYENGREYTGFLTIFYKQGNKYICLHDGISYELKGANFIENLVPLNELLPKINTEILSEISIPRALELFDILFKQQTTLYNKEKQPISDYYIGDIVLKETYHQETLPDSKYTYINLPHHIILDKSNLAFQTFQEDNYMNIVYRCLFLKQDLDLYNLHNHQFYNSHEDTFQSIISFQEHIKSIDITIPSETISIPKALKLFKKTI